MRRRPKRRESPLVYAAVGASILAIPASAAAATAVIAPSPDHSSSGPSIKAHVKRPSVHYGYPAVVVGRALSSDRGRTIALEFTRVGSGDWRQIASARVGSDGGFRLVGWPRSSGWVRAAIQAPVASAATLLPLGPRPSSSTSSSAPERLAVSATIRARPRAVNALGAQTISVRGRLLPAGGRRWIELQTDPSGRWVAVTAARTDARGWFVLRYRPGGLGRQLLRIRFAGDRDNAAAASGAGTVTVYQQALASWYDDAGTTACGFHATYGVANLSLPCGTKVNFEYGGRTVQAVVDDRGPYVGGRTWDLNQNTAAALGFGGVGAVWSSR
ncbi:MAG TPA: septal ring lytic transglycosylase RlpA family protein [Solirubrobacteraceae bacterium]|jgi:hypothetical protein